MSYSRDCSRNGCKRISRNHGGEQIPLRDARETDKFTRRVFLGARLKPPVQGPHSLLLYFLRGSVKYRRRTRSQIQVRGSTCVRLGSRAFLPAIPDSVTHACVLAQVLVHRAGSLFPWGQRCVRGFIHIIVKIDLIVNRYPVGEFRNVPGSYQDFLSLKLYLFLRYRF